MLYELTRCELLVWSQLLGRGGKILDCRLLLNTQIGMAKFRPTFSDSIWLRQVFTAMRETQCSSGTLPEYCDNFWKTL